MNNRKLFIDGNEIVGATYDVDLLTEWAESTSFWSNEPFQIITKKQLDVTVRLKPLGYVVTADILHLYTKAPELQDWQIAYVTHKGIKTVAGNAQLYFNDGFNTPEALAFKAGYECNNECKDELHLEDYKYE